MRNIVIAFPKMEIAQSVKKIVAQSGYPVTAVCTTGAQALQQVENLENGIVICGYRFVDMMYGELLEYLPGDFHMLLIASANVLENGDAENLICLETPLKVQELLETLERMDNEITQQRRRRRLKPRVRSEEEIKIMEQAKTLLMEQNHMTEEEAHRYIQKRSMDNGTGLIETAQMILKLMGEE
ncbi:MAG: ANTAR domain-containing protein [Lachnospiraceae bacterium]|nr:ANTAR domain-containing protein [Lachnospiraceae bacterium]MDD6504039.1 ANTAR domain-containing protein [Lachnospiraceae bacterium]